MGDIYAQRKRNDSDINKLCNIEQLYTTVPLNADIRAQYFYEDASSNKKIQSEETVCNFHMCWNPGKGQKTRKRTSKLELIARTV